MARINLPRYRLQNLTRRELEDEAWQGTHPDFRTVMKGVRTVMWQGGLEKLSKLPVEELQDRALSSLGKSLQKRARAQDLSLYEQNPAAPEASILFAGVEILFKTRTGWTLAYIQPSHFNEVELLKARKYAQVVAHLYANESAEFVVKKLREASSYSDWKKLEKSGAVVRGDEGIVEIRGKQPSSTTVLIRHGNLHIHVKDAREPTDRELHDAGIILSDAHLYLSGLGPQDKTRHLFRREQVVPGFTHRRLP